MLRLQQIKIEIPEGITGTQIIEIENRLLPEKIRKLLKISPKNLVSWKILKRSIDARKKPVLYYSYVIDVAVRNENEVLRSCKDKRVEVSDLKEYKFPYVAPTDQFTRPVIIGMGPAGLFCGYFLAMQGFCPIILERGKPVEERVSDVQKFWETGFLNTESNVQFGEGGAGTFSDGKLNTLVKDKYGRNREVLRILVEHGAPDKILYDHKPHIGTDVLIHVVKSMREKMISLGADIRYNCRMNEIIIDQNKVKGITTVSGEVIYTDLLVLAPGHSARDTFEMLYKRRIPMAAKAFAVGFRVEHPQSMIDCQQYGKECPLCLTAAEYKVTAKSQDERGVYSFCMCPGGYVVNASSEEGRLAVNGMSYSGRSGKNANSAIIISVGPEDFGCSDPLAGVEFQRKIEEKAYKTGNGKIPVQYYKDFKKKSEHTGHIEEDFTPMIKGQYIFADVNNILPDNLNDAFIQGMEHFHNVIPGFGDDYAIVSGVESRTSSPLKIFRNENGESEILGLFPCGEGAGYAGGITSAAMDGIFIAEKIAATYYRH